jgi:hypothetical protein
MRGVEGACKRIHHPLLHFAKICCLATSALTPWDPENNRLPLHTPVPSRISVIIFPSSSSRLKKGGEKKGEKVKEERLGIDFLSCSMFHVLGKVAPSISWSPGIGQITSATKYGPSHSGNKLCLPFFIYTHHKTKSPTSKVSHLPGRPQGEPSRRGTAGVSASTRLTLRR